MIRKLFKWKGNDSRGKTETLGMKEGQILLGKSNSMFFLINSLKYILTAKIIKLVAVSMYVDVVNGNYNIRRGKAKGT